MYNFQCIILFNFIKEHCEKLEYEKRSLERLLEIEVMNSYHLSREVTQLKLANKKLKIDVDHLILDRNY